MKLSFITPVTYEMLSRVLVRPLRRQFASRTPPPVLTMFTKDPCPLCDQALGELERYKDLYQLEKVDITLPENKKWYKEYRFDIPVFHLNGSFLMKHRVDHEKMHRELLQANETSYPNKS